MRILQVISDTDRRGAQTFALDLACALGRKGHSVETVALAPGRQASPLDVDVLGIGPRHPRMLRELRRRMGPVDITVAHGSSTLLACALSGRPFVYRQISDSRFWAKGWSRRLRVAAFLRRTEAIVALSPGAQADLIEYLWVQRERTHIVPNGVPRTGFHHPQPAERAAARMVFGLPSDGFVALYIGALVPEKGVDHAIRVLRQRPDITLVIAGDGPDRARLAKLAADDPVIFVGVAAEPMQVYASADVVLLPSQGGDSMPATLIEAGFCGLPSIATAVGSIEDIVVHDETGLIVQAGDEAELASALARLADDAELRNRLGRAAFEHCAANFDIDVVADRWMTVLEPFAGRSDRDRRSQI